MARVCNDVLHTVLLILSVCLFIACDAQWYIDDCTPANGRLTWRGDGDCNWENNIAECDYDLGDCCECTCSGSSDYSCGINGYLCLDPDAFDDDSEQNICTQETTPCRMGVQEEWSIENTEDAQALAETIKCSGGSFQVEWGGRVVVPATIEVIDGTVLNVTGVGSGAVMDGNGTTRIFRVVNASLTLINVEVWNGSATYGGALAASSSILSFDRTAFVNNVAFEKRGGAIFAHDGSVLTFAGETNFFNNSGISGGAVYISSGSNASWAGTTTFSMNNAYRVNGGAVAVKDGSSASWTGNTTFLGNTAGNYRGGAIAVEDASIVTLCSYASFIGNHGKREGGAIFVATESIVTMSGDTLFSHNTAEFDGGAIAIGDSSSISWNETTYFDSNYAGDNGGAISSYMINSGATPSSATEGNLDSFLLINGTTRFVNNSCGSNGGAMALLGGLSVTFMTKNLMFSENKAGVAGGGLFISATGVGPIITNASFLANSAEVGAGAYITGSGTARNLFGDLPTTFDGCRFIDNRAGATGGAIESSVGADEIIDTVFKRNIARVGGALRLAGKASIKGCSFEDNVAVEEGGPAVYSIGYIIEMSNCHFNGNVFDCEEGTFLSSASVNSSDDIQETLCKGCGLCEDCTYEEPEKVPTCSVALDNSISPGGYSTTIEDLLIEPGYWRATSTSEKVLACYNVDACNGGLTSALDYCYKGYEGPYCSVCAKNYVAGADFTCTACSDNVGGVVLAAVVSIIALVVVVSVILHVMSPEVEGARRGIFGCVMRHVPLQPVKIVIVSWQILTQFFTLADVIFPDMYQRFLNAVDIFNLDLSWIVSAGCIIDIDFHGRLLVVTIVPIAVLLLLGVTYTIASWKNSGLQAALVEIRHKHVSIVLLVMFFVYSSVSSALFQMFDCEVLDDGKDYLRADYSIECDKPRHRALLIYTGFMIILYPVGIPAFYALLLFKNRSVLKNKTSRERALLLRSGSERWMRLAREDALSVRSTSDLWKPYKPSRFYYEVIECGRRILLTGVILVVDDDSAAQIAVSLMLAILFALLSEGLAPYESHLDAWVSRLGHVVVSMSMYFALLLKVDVSEETQPSQEAFEVVLIAIHFGMIFTVIMEAIMTSYSFSTQQLEHPMPRALCSSERVHFRARSTRGPFRVHIDSLPGNATVAGPTLNKKLAVCQAD